METDATSPDAVIDWVLFSVEKYGGRLELTNVLFEQFRMRINAIINIREGDVVMNNVDFDGIEIGNNRAYTL